MKVLTEPILWLRTLLVLAFWGILLTHYFFFDVPDFLSARVPWLGPVIEFPLLLVLGVWLSLGTRRFFVCIAYAIFYPLIAIGWGVPRFLFHNWPVLVAFSPAIHAFFRNFKSRIILLIGAIVSSFAIILGTNSYVVSAGIGFLIGYLLLHYFWRFQLAFSPSTVFAELNQRIRGFLETMKTSDALKPDGIAAAETDEQKRKFAGNLLGLYALTTGLYVLGERLRRVANSQKLDLYFLGSLLCTFILTVVVFAVSYFGLERLYTGSFQGVPNPNLADFLGMSFSILMTSDISPLKPISGWAQAGVYVELFGSLLIAVLLVFVILTSIRERYKKDFDAVVGELGTASEEMRSVLERNAALTVTGVERLLIEHNPLVTGWFLKWRYGEKQANVMLLQSRTDKSESPKDAGSRSQFADDGTSGET